MRKLALILLTFLIIGKCTANQQQIEQKALNFDPRAIVVLGYLDWRQGGSVSTRFPRVAFAIGDGTLLMTAAHCVGDFKVAPDDPISIDTVVISPYYGDVYDFEIVAVDKKADLAILKAPWPRHPALSIAGEEEFAGAAKILIASRPQDNDGKSFNKDYESFHIGREIRTELLPVLHKDGDNPAMALRLKGTKYVAPGWSGSPMLIPETGKIVGILNRLNVGVRAKLFGLITLSKRNDAYGCNLQSIQALINKHNLGAAALAPTPELEDISDAEDNFNLAMDFFEAPFIGEVNTFFQIAKEFSQARSDSVQAHLLLAFSAAVKAKDPNVSENEYLNQAEAGYKKAIQLGPDNAHAHAAYGNFLKMIHRNKEALEQCDASLAIDPNNRMALFNKLMIIEPSERKEIAERFLSLEPNNARVLFYYSSALRGMGENEKALQAAQKAVALDPNDLFYGSLADALASLHRLDEAEPYYKLMTEKCGCQQCWFKYALFLIRNRPNKLDEAAKALEQAESKSRERRVSKDDMDAVKLELLSKTAPEQAKIMANELLETSPDNGYYWFLLADILRTLEKYEQAVEAAQKAVDLNPERSYRPRLANCLAKAGELEKAEKIYHELHEEFPERNRYWFWYAEFLVDYFEDRIEEAQEALEKASSNPDKVWFVPEDDLKELQEKIDVKAASIYVR